MRPQEQDEAGEKLEAIYQRIKLMNNSNQLTEDDLALVRWAFGIQKEQSNEMGR